MKMIRDGLIFALLVFGGTVLLMGDANALMTMHDKENVQTIVRAVEFVTFITAIAIVWFVWRISKRASKRKKSKQVDS